MAVLGLAILGSAIAVGQVPETLAYQGHLKGRDGISLSGNYDISFALYDQRSGGTELWRETHPAVPIQNGRFYVELGSVVSFGSASVVFDQQYFLGITVGSDSEMVPRLPLNSVGYAFNALRAENAQRAVHSQGADHSSAADRSNKSDEADYALLAGHAATADSAVAANRALKADTALATAVALGLPMGDVAVVGASFKDPGMLSQGTGYYTSVGAALDDVASWCDVTGGASCLLRILPGRYEEACAGAYLGYVDYSLVIEGSGRSSTEVVLPSHCKFYLSGESGAAQEVRDLSWSLDPGTAGSTAEALHLLRPNVTLENLFVGATDPVFVDTQPTATKVGGDSLHAQGVVLDATVGSGRFGMWISSSNQAEFIGELRDLTVKSSSDGVVVMPKDPAASDGSGRIQLLIEDADIEAGNWGVLSGFAVEDLAVWVRGSRIRAPRGLGVISGSMVVRDSDIDTCVNGNPFLAASVDEGAILDLAGVQLQGGVTSSGTCRATPTSVHLYSSHWTVGEGWTSLDSDCSYQPYIACVP